MNMLFITRELKALSDDFNQICEMITDNQSTLRDHKEKIKEAQKERRPLPAVVGMLPKEAIIDALVLTRAKLDAIFHYMGLDTQT